MTTEELRDIIHRETPDYFAKTFSQDKRGKGIVCPICGSGSGKNGTGPTSRKGEPHRYTCWAGCYTNADAIEIIGGGLLAQSSFMAKLKYTAEYMGISYTLDDYPPMKAPEKPKPRQTDKEPAEDLTDFFLKANQNLKPDYLEGRGISRETQDNFLIGYVKDWKHPASPKAPATERIIIPTSETSYLARDINDSGQYSKQKVGSTTIFNAAALDTKEPVYITEGEIDALSLIELGYKAVGLGGTGNAQHLISYLKEHPTGAPLLLVPDADAPGEKTMKELLKDLEALEADARIISITGDTKDPNERLMKDRAGLDAAIKAETEKALNLINYQSELYRQSSALHHLGDFTEYINQDKPRIKTGFTRLDRALGGGIMDGQLIVIGAVSGAGKTTFALQVMDNIAKSGRDVLIFSLEMSRNELIAKSISRETRWNDMPEYFVGSATAQEVININEQDPQKRERIEKAVNEYARYAGLVYIREGNMKMGTKEIIKGIKDHVKFTGRAPVVLIDYIQVLTPDNPTNNDKNTIDETVRDLKITARDLQLPIIGISSFNRTSYEKLSMAGMKGSGNIEYTADTLLSIGYRIPPDFRAGDDPDFLELKKRFPAPTKIKILKSRTGVAGDTIPMDFYNAHNYFHELPAWDEPATE